MFIVVAYDIADPQRLRRVAKVMEDFGDRVQQSIFEMDCGLSTFERMRYRTELLLNMEEDGVKYFFLCERCAGRSEYIGLTVERTPDNQYQIL
jgi:CRISPR-associated protein Cas2